jgi:hypothetical protein
MVSFTSFSEAHVRLRPTDLSNQFLQSLSAEYFGDIRRLLLHIMGKVYLWLGSVQYNYAVDMELDLTSSARVKIKTVIMPTTNRIPPSRLKDEAFKEKMQDNADKVADDIVRNGRKLQIQDISALRKVVESAAELLG